MIRHFNIRDAILVAKELEIDFSKYKWNAGELAAGMNIECNYRGEEEEDPITIARTVVTHLKESSDYYERLNKRLRENVEISKKKEKEVFSGEWVQKIKKKNQEILARLHGEECVEKDGKKICKKKVVKKKKKNDGTGIGYNIDYRV